MIIIILSGIDYKNTAVQNAYSRSIVNAYIILHTLLVNDVQQYGSRWQHRLTSHSSPLREYVALLVVTTEVAALEITE